MSCIKEKIKNETPLTWLFYGDSITHGVVHTYGSRAYPELVSERVRFELDRLRDVFVNTAISGNKASDLLCDFDWRVSRFNPDIVFVMIGVNDTCQKVPIEDFRINLEVLFERVRELGAELIMQTSLPPIALKEGEDANESICDPQSFNKYMDALRQFARKNTIVLIDHLKKIRESGLNNQLIMSDSVHPNKYGHRFIAQNICKEIGIYDSNSNACGLFLPR